MTSPASATVLVFLDPDYEFGRIADPTQPQLMATDQGATAGGGTRVGDPGPRRGATGVAGMRQLTRVHVKDGRGAELLEALARDRVPLKRLVHHAAGATALFARDDVPDWTAVRARLQAALGASLVACEEDVAAATVVGEGIGSDPATVERVLAVARRLGIELDGHDASPLRITLYLAPRRLDELVRALHAELV